MARRDGGSSSGCINWPTHINNSGEGGMWVYALVRAVYDDHYDDVFVHCCGPDATIALPAPDVVVSDHDELYDPPQRYVSESVDPHGHVEWLHHSLSCGASVLAAVCLGTSGGSWSYFQSGHEQEGEERGDNVYWQCRERDLTAEGQQLVTLLKQMYDRPVELVTYLDT